MTAVIDRYRLAGAHLEAGDPLEALRLLGPLEEELADQVAGQLLLARAYYHSAQLGRAQAALERVVELDPSDSWARFLLGRTLERRSRLAEALPHYRLAAAMSGDPEHAERRDAVAARLDATR